MSKRRFASFALLLCCVLLSGAVFAQTPLTFQADADLRPGLEALYTALYDGGALTYADTDADVLVTSDADALADAADTLPDFFLPGAGIVALTDTPDAAVSVGGVIGWVGLVIPHAGRILVGPDHMRLLPAAFSLGACFLLLIDNVSRTLLVAEVPLGVLTGLIGVPLLIALLRRSRTGW